MFKINATIKGIESHSENDAKEIIINRNGGTDNVIICLVSEEKPFPDTLIRRVYDLLNEKVRGEEVEENQYKARIDFHWGNNYALVDEYNLSSAGDRISLIRDLSKIIHHRFGLSYGDGDDLARIWIGDTFPVI